MVCLHLCCMWTNRYLVLEVLYKIALLIVVQVTNFKVKICMMKKEEG